MDWRLEVPRPTNDAILAGKLGYRSILWRQRLLGRASVVTAADPHYGPMLNRLGPKGDRWMVRGIAAYFGRRGVSWVWPVWFVRDAGHPDSPGGDEQ